MAKRLLSYTTSTSTSQKWIIKWLLVSKKSILSGETLRSLSLGWPQVNCKFLALTRIPNLLDINNINSFQTCKRMETIWAEHSTSLPNLIGRVTHKTHAEIKLSRPQVDLKVYPSRESIARNHLVR